MQIIVDYPGSALEYQQSEAFRRIGAPGPCARCQQGRLVAFAYYDRNVSGDDRSGVIRIRVRRFRCTLCEQTTTSCLPSFAQPYRVVSTPRLESHALEGDSEEEATASKLDPWLPLLRIYLRTISRFLGELFKRIGNFFGRPPPEARCDARALIIWLAKHCGGLATATMQLVNQMNICLFGIYRCHQRTQHKASSS